MAIRGKKGKNPPYLSQEFLIQNHGDIVSCVCMLVMVGLMFTSTQPLSQVFVAAQHNVTKPVTEGQEPTIMYNTGMKDICTILFYTCCWIVVQAIIQEYILDKFSRRFHMSKTKHSKFNDSGNLLPFFLLSIGVGIDLITKNETFPHFSKLWDNYPQTEMSFTVKFYFVLQIAYWLHCFPELYFMKTRKEEYPTKMTMYAMYLAFIIPTYIMSGSQIALLLLSIHYVPEAIFHATRLIHCAGKQDLARHGFLFWAVSFVLARLATISLTILIIGFGMVKAEVQYIDYPSGNYNTRLLRWTWVAAIVLNQAWMAYNFIVFQMKRYREKAHELSVKKSRETKSLVDKKKTKRDTPKKSEETVQNGGSPRAKQD